MKFDNLIIGGGLSGLVSGIISARSGRNTVIISTGQSALHFWSGAFGFLNHFDGHDVIDSPLKKAEQLPDEHPYRRLGIGRTASLLDKAVPLLAEAGIKVRGSLDRNHYRVTPMGFVKPAWLTLDEYMAFKEPGELKGKRLAIVNIRSYIDFYPRFLAYGLGKLGAECKEHVVDIPELDTLRRSTTEMRATNMSRFLHTEAVARLAREIDRVSTGADAVVMPAILGMFSDEPVKQLQAAVGRPVYFIATTPASVPGVRCQLALRDYFTRLGGTFIPGDTVTGGVIENHRLRSVSTVNFGDMPLYADNFVISTGSFFGHGLVATIDRVFEPVLNLDLNCEGKGRTDWYKKNLYESQPYMSFGVVTDDEFRPSVKGETIENLYATGALLSGFNALKEGSGAGITLATALHAGEKVTG